MEAATLLCHPGNGLADVFSFTYHSAVLLFSTFPEFRPWNRTNYYLFIGFFLYMSVMGASKKRHGLCMDLAVLAMPAELSSCGSVTKAACSSELQIVALNVIMAELRKGKIKARKLCFGHVRAEKPQWFPMQCLVYWLVGMRDWQLSGCMQSPQ